MTSDDKQELAEAADRVLQLIREDEDLSLVLAVNDGAGSKRVWYQLGGTYRAWAEQEGLTMGATGPDAERVALQVVRAFRGDRPAT